VVEPTVKLKFLSHGTLECRDLAFTRNSMKSSWALKSYRPVTYPSGSDWGVLIVTPASKRDAKTPWECSVITASMLRLTSSRRGHRLVVRDAAFGSCTNNQARLQHGAYSFYFWDADDNCWRFSPIRPGLHLDV